MCDLNLRDCLIYLDDVIIFSQDFDQHIESESNVNYSSLE